MRNQTQNKARGERKAKNDTKISTAKSMESLAKNGLGNATHNQ